MKNGLQNSAEDTGQQNSSEVIDLQNLPEHSENTEGSPNEKGVRISKF